jgi:ribosomal protein S18 acetylase RimI-like enzyme
MNRDTASLDYLSSSRYWLGWFAVAKKLRRQRIGTRLLRRVEGDLRSLRQRKVFVSTEDSNSVAKDFYTDNGFRTEGVIRDYYGNREDELIMSKELL